MYFLLFLSIFVSLKTTKLYKLNFMQDKQSARRKISSSKSDAGLQEQQRAPNSNQKKLDSRTKKLNSFKSLPSQPSQNDDENLKKHKKWKQTLLLNTYMGSFIKKASAYSFYCNKCKSDIISMKGKEDIWCENLYAHITSKLHKKNTPEGERSKLTELENLIEKRASQKGKDIQKNEIGKENEETSEYLKFLGFLLAERLSYSQINRIGKFIQSLYQKDKLQFLENASFDEEMLSKIVSECFRPSLLDQLYEDLSKFKFSFSIDNSTMIGESLCGLKVKYLKESELEDGKFSLEILNKVIGLSSLKESSDAATIFEIVHQKIFVDERIMNNFIGVTHDNASTLASQANGLAGKLKDSLPHFIYDLCDPCHCLNLALKHSLESLPDEVLDFVNRIHHHFAFPQRKAALKRIQEENNMEILLLKEYGQTRWLSLGQCMERLLKIWPSLELYTSKTIERKKLTSKFAKSVKKLDSFLKNKVFKLKIMALSFMVNQINLLSQLLQSQIFNLGELRTEMIVCFKLFLN